MEIEQAIEKLVNNWDKIDDKYKTDLRPNQYKTIKGLPKEQHFVILLLDRQKPSVEPCYDFDQERIGINRFGKVIWGFDSGCSCPQPWYDNFDNCYNISKSWKEFKVNLEQFDKEVLEECSKQIKLILEELK